MLSDKELQLLDKIQKKAVYENNFFEKRAELKWFDELKKRGYFNPNPETYPQESKEKGYYAIPQWNVLPYLVKVSQQINVPDNEKYIDELLGIIRAVTNYHIEHDKVLDNYRTWYHFTKILLNLPNEKITDDIINLIPTWLDSKFDATLQGSAIALKLLSKFLTDNPEDIKKAEAIIDYITKFKAIPLNEERARLLGKEEEFRLVIDSHWLKESFDKYSETIGSKCSRKVVEDLTNKIKCLLKSEDDETYHSFYDETEYHITEPMEMLTFILKRVLLAKAINNVTATRETLKQFLEDNYLYFPKMAIYVMGQNMEKYNALFWEALATKTGDLMMEKTLHFGDELKHLLESLQNLTDGQREVLNKKIENVVKRHDYKEYAERYIALSKQEIYGALSHDEYFKNLYDEKKRITKVDAELHPAVGKVETRWGPGSAPFSKEEIIKMPNDKLAEFLAIFKTKNFLNDPTVGGLSNLIAEVAKEMPEKFIENLSPFRDTGFIYIYEIVSGIKNAWKGKKIIDWNKVFKFLEQYIDRNEFWEDKFIVEKDGFLGKANHQWVAGIVAQLVEDGTRDDSWAFPEEHFNEAEKIVFLLLENLKADEDKEITDYVFYTLNTSLGKAITAFILLALRIARVNDKKENKSDIKWSTKFKGKYEVILNNKIIEGYTCLGRYLPNFYYLNKEWIKEKIKSLENEKGSKSWEAFIDGYLSIGKVYDDLYKLMRPHYQYGIECDFKEKHNNKHLIQHISLAYLRGHESLDKSESLFKQVLDKFDYDKVKGIIGYFWMQGGYLTEQDETSENVRKKIIDFWRWLYEKYRTKEILSAEDKKIISDTGKLATILPQINKENADWLMLAAPYVHEDFSSSFFIEYLDKLKDKGDREETAKYIGEIFLKMLEKFTPDYDEKHIRSIVEFLCMSNNTNDGRAICDIYGRRGFEFLRNIYAQCFDKQ